MTFSKTFKTILITILMAVTLLFSQTPIALVGAGATTGFAQNGQNLASQANDASKNLTLVSNADFTSTGSSTSSYVYAPSSWTLGSSDELKSLKYGVINLSELESRAKDYGLQNEQPLLTKSSEEKVLMINSDSATAGSKLNYYQSITLDAGSFYRIGVNVYTSQDAFGSIYLDNDNFDATKAKMDSINTNKNWDTYYFFVATSPYSSQSVSLNLYLGSKDITSTGYVLFDNISVVQYSENKFDQLTSGLTSNSKLIDQRVNKITDRNDYGFVETDITKWTSDSHSDSTYVEQVGTNYVGSNGNLNNVVPGTNFSSGTALNGIALSADSGYISFKSPDIKIERNGLYKISFYAKGEITSGNMNVVLSGTISNTPDGEDETVLSASLTSINNTSKTFTNDWNEYAFYVSGNSLYDTTVNLYLGLGSASTPATGYVVYAYISSYKLNSTEYSDGQAINTTTKLSMSASATLNFANSSFNSITQSDDKTLPDTPASWNQVLGDKNATTVSGVVNTLSSNLSQYLSLGAEVNSPKTKYGDYSNNVLVMYNKTPTYQGYYNTESYTISSGSYYLMTVDVNMQRSLLSDTNSGAYIYLKDNNGNNLAWFRFAGNSTDEWQTLKIYIKGSFQDRSVVPHLYMGSEEKPTQGIVYFDNCKIVESDENAFNSATNGATTRVVNLGTDQFTLYDKVDNKVYSPSLWKITNGDQSNVTSKLGIVKSSNLPDFITTNPINDDSGNADMLMIGSVEEAYYTYANKIDFDLSSDTYYKLTIDVKTLMLQHTIDPETENENTPFGVTVELSGIDKAKITDINTQTSSTEYTTLGDALNDKDNKFVTYTIYLCPTESTSINIQLSLGKNNQLCSGYAFFKNLELTQIDKDTYDSDVAILTNNNKTELPSTVLSLVDATEEESDTENETYSTNNDWWASVFTIIIALAVLVAVIGFAVKKISERRKETVSVSNNYDRLETLLKDVDRRNKVSDINLKIRNLQEELKQSERFLQEEKESFAKESASYQTAKEIANDTGIAIESPQKKLDAMQKNIDELEQKIAGITLDIEVLEEEKNRIKLQEKRDLEKAKKTKVIKNRK